MKTWLRFFIPLSLLVVISLSGCEIPRPGGVGDIKKINPIESTPSAGTITDTVPIAGVTPIVPPVGSDETIETKVASAPTAPDAAAFEKGQVLVKLRTVAAGQAMDTEVEGQSIGAITGVPSFDKLLKQVGAGDIEPLVKTVGVATDKETEIISAQAQQVGQIYAVTLPPEGDPVQVAKTLAQDPSVEYAEPNYLVGITAEPVSIPSSLGPNDPYYKYQWNLQAIQMPIAWDSSKGEGVIVAIVDTGVDFGAPDLANVARLPGYDFANNDNDPTDDQGHGTHVAGTIAQNTNNGIGVAGVAFGVKLLPVKTLDSKGQGNYENIIKGIIYAVDQGAKVINMSLAGKTGSKSLQEAVKYAYSKGVVVVVASGNSNSAVEYPAAYDDFVIAVGAVRFDLTRAPYSNFGSQIDLVAPGGDVHVDQNGDTFGDGIIQQTFSTSGSGYSYRFFEGTSMASPHVAGLAALILSRKPDASPAQVETIMAQTAKNLGSPEQYGAGLIQAANALQAVTGSPVAVSPTITPAVVQVPTNTPTAVTVEKPTNTPTPATLMPTVTPVVEALTPTPLPAPLPAGELLVNSNFESKDGWIFGDTPLPGQYSAEVVHGGSQAIRLGTTSGSDIFSYSSIWQKVTIPTESNKVVLIANVYLLSQDNRGDNQTIMILNDRFRVVKTLSQGLSNSKTWETRSFDLSDLRGQTIYVYFGVFNNGSGNRLTAMVVDDVSLTWGK